MMVSHLQFTMASVYSLFAQMLHMLAAAYASVTNKLLVTKQAAAAHCVRFSASPSHVWSGNTLFLPQTGLAGSYLLLLEAISGSPT